MCVRLVIDVDLSDTLRLPDRLTCIIYWVPSKDYLQPISKRAVCFMTDDKAPVLFLELFRRLIETAIHSTSTRRNRVLYTLSKTDFIIHDALLTVRAVLFGNHAPIFTNPGSKTLESSEKALVEKCCRHD